MPSLRDEIAEIIKGYGTIETPPRRDDFLHLGYVNVKELATALAELFEKRDNYAYTSVELLQAIKSVIEGGQRCQVNPEE